MDTDHQNELSETDDVPWHSQDQLYRALAKRRRRRVLYLLLEEETLSVDQLATMLVGWDVTESGGMATPREHEQIVISLHHNHLPMLDDTGLVAYDHHQQTVSIESLETAVRDWIRQYLSIDHTPNS